MGRCSLRCGGGTGNCDGDVTNGCETTLDNVTHCGACARACPVRPESTPACVAGACVLTCAGGRANCDGSDTNGCEVDTATNPSHCGACGRACGMGQACNGGVCGACPTTRTRCGAACVDTQTDVANCGACGIRCPMGQSCTAGTCRCPDGQTLCGATCINAQTDAQNCGGCGRSCGTARNSSVSCVAGACRFSCDFGGWRNCNGDAFDGCECWSLIGCGLAACTPCGNQNQECCGGRCRGTLTCMSGRCR